MRHTRHVSSIFNTQLGFIAERELTKLLIQASGGELEVMAPTTDDERRDLQVQIRGQFTRSVVFQVKRKP